SYSEKGLLVQEKLVADFPRIPQYRSELATAYMNNCGLLADMDRLDEGLRVCQKALALHEALAAKFPGVPSHAVNLGGSYCNMGGLLNDLNRQAEALPWLDKALHTLDGALARDPGHATARQFRANVLSTRADAFAKLHRYPEALRDYE